MQNDTEDSFTTPRKPPTEAEPTGSRNRTRQVLGSGNAGTVIAMRLATGSPFSPLRKVTEEKETRKKFKILKELQNGKTIARKISHELTGIGKVELQHELDMLRAIRYPLISDEVLQDGDGHYYIDMQCMPGQRLNEWKDEQDLPFSERMSLVLELVEQLCDMHRRGVVHCDLKPQNTLINKKAKAEEKAKIEPNISIVDLGIGLQIPPDTEQLNRHTHGAVKDYGLNAEYCPPEALHTKNQISMFGFATDTYMLVGLIAQLFGEKEAYKFKLAADDEVEKVKQPFDLSGIQIPDMELNKSIDLRKIVVDFLNQMQAFNYRDRPNDKELFKFFLKLYQLVLCDKNQKKYDKFSKDWNDLDQQKNDLAQELLNIAKLKNSKRKAIICTVSVLILAGGAIGVAYWQAPKRTANFFQKNMVDFFKQDVTFSKDFKMPTYQVLLVAAALLAGAAASYYLYQKYKIKTENAEKQEQKGSPNTELLAEQDDPRKQLIFLSPARSDASS